jgi:hypothetical protein
VLGAACPYGVRADGYLPSQPYHYLHPPAAVARTNKPPASVSRTYTLTKGRIPSDFVLFTHDTQAGLGAHPGDIIAPTPAKSVTISIRPVSPPGRMPDHRLLDGNAYNVRVLGEPGNRAVRLHHTVSLALRWPHSPSAILRYSGGRWVPVCSRPHWVVSPPNLVICQVSALGTFAAVRQPIR